ncbi:hypothetical protein Ciccas_013291, partial [Cichlidogyrus casuarinus]
MARLKTILGYPADLPKRMLPTKRDIVLFYLFLRKPHLSHTQINSIVKEMIAPIQEVFNRAGIEPVPAKIIEGRI